MTMITTDIACVGDLMFECIIHGATWPAMNPTLVLDSPGQEIGGAAFNTCWNLAHLGRPPRLIAPFGCRQARLVREALAAASLDDSGLIETEGDTDLLIVVVKDDVYQGVYLRGRLPGSLDNDVHSRIEHPRCLILVGSRHPAMRRVSLRLAETFEGELLVFSPAYAIYEYGADELEPLIRRTQVTIVNAYEADHIRRTLGVTSIQHLAASVPGTFVVTLAHEGARIFECGRVLEFGSYARSAVDAFGAGDAFLAGFLIEKLRGADTAEAARFASMCGAYVVEAARVRVVLAEPTIRQWLRERVGAR
jgi:sugar/nucleoside kinase (ribokinase family)